MLLKYSSGTFARSELPLHHAKIRRWPLWFAVAGLVAASACSAYRDDRIASDSGVPDTGPADTGPDTTVYDGSSCGNGVLEGKETCDDGNTEPGDGCAANCRVERHFGCTVPGSACVKLCGNALFDDDEACDDGNTSSGDGCSADCEVEAGWGCARPGSACVALPVCGNGMRERGEDCDSGPLGDPGCVACKSQPGYWCTQPGLACVAQVCGDSVRTPDEDCDDGNGSSGDGCSSKCKIEQGFRCSSNGCRPICGDMLIRGAETCEDGNTTGGDGCSAGCGLEPGWSCPVVSAACGAAECGNGQLEAGEGCDDHNVISGDGCGSTCQLEPEISVGSNPVVQTRCGDGLRTSAEACDDGNAANGDGCSASCAIERGFGCEDRLEEPTSVAMKVTYRDFKPRNLTGGHPHMWPDGALSDGANAGLDLGLVGSVCNTQNGASCGRLDAEGKPQIAPGKHTLLGNHPSPESFALWYRDNNAGSITGLNGAIDVMPRPTPVPSAGDFLVLTQVSGQNAYRFDSEGNKFYPLDARGYGDTTAGGATHNWNFTTELRYFFQYKGGETLSFYGDDDVWVFINGRLAVDIGGIHGQLYGRVVLGDDGGPTGVDSDCSVHGGLGAPAACEPSAEESADNTDSRFGLTKGQVYEIALFHAERHPTGSNFQLTLTGFLAPRSYCTPICGDSIVAGWELCDSGAKNADGVYGVCNTTCSGIEYCGDNIVQSDHEACDNGFNLDLVSTPNACAPGCKLPPTCGDGVVQAPFELCDNGSNNSDTTYGGCSTSCDWGPYCGDGHIDPGEQCDDGPGNVAATEAGRCGYDCKPAFILL